MTARPDPIVIQFAVPPSSGSDSLSLVVDPATGLLRQPGATAPFVEELIATAHKWRDLAGADTILTKTTDPGDPDLVRASASSRLSEAVSTSQSNAEMDQSDPDLIRSDRFHQWMEGVVTHQTRQVPDAPDPDLVRAQSARDWRVSGE